MDEGFGGCGWMRDLLDIDCLGELEMKPMSRRVEGATVDGSEILQSPLGMVLKPW